MRPLNVLFVSHGATLGGAERVLLDFLGGLDPTRFSASVVVPSAGPILAELDRLKVARFVLSAPWWLPYEHEAEVGYHFRHYWETAPTFVDPILRLIDERQIDIVYSCSSPILHAALAAHVARRPHVQHMQDLLGWPHLGTKTPFGSAHFAYGLIGMLSTVVVCAGRTIRDDIGRAIPARKCRVVPYGFEDPVGSRAVGPQRDRSTVRVGLAGTVDRRKGSEIIGAVVRRVCRDAPDVRFVWAGVGEPRVIERVTAECRIDGISYLECSGFTDRVADFMAGVDILLHPSRNDTFPRVLLEAGLARLPVVATRSGGAAEIIEDGVTGRLVPVDDVEAIAEAVLELVRDPDHRRRMGERARAFCERFDMAAYRAGMRRALADAHDRGPAIRGRVASRAATALLYAPSIIAKLLRRWGLHRVWHAVNHSRQRAST